MAFLTTDVPDIKDVEDVVQEAGVVSEYVKEHIPMLIGFGIKIVLAIVCFCIGRVIIGWIRRFVGRALARSKAEKGVEQFVDSLLKYALYFLLIFTIATKFGVDTTSVAALIASGGVAIGLALQGSFANLAGGVLILILKPFEVGDYIIEDTNKNEGTVTDIQIFYTKLNTIDNRTIVIPNGTLTNNSLTNISAQKERRLDLKINITYETDLRKAKEITEEILRADEQVMKDREILVFVASLADSSVVIGARAWTKTEEYYTTMWRVQEEIKLRFDEEGVEMAYPHLKVHMAK